MTVWVAELTPEDVLIGFKKMETAPEGAVIVPPDCDLKTDGRYRWNRDLARFDPIMAVVTTIGDTAALNTMIAQVLAGLVTPDALPADVRQRVVDSVEFIRATTSDEAMKSVVAEARSRTVRRGARKRSTR